MKINKMKNSQKERENIMLHQLININFYLMDKITLHEPLREYNLLIDGQL